jgi:ribosomal protein S18 acetylase RimI-like enzyme
MTDHSNHAINDAASAHALEIRLACIEDIPAIEWLDTFGTSPHRDINRDVEKYFGSVDPSIHEHNLIFLAEISGEVPAGVEFPIIGKVELLLAPADAGSDIGYIKRVVVHPAFRGKHIARILIEYICHRASEYGVRYLDLHVWEGNQSAIRLYESLGFNLRHRELYFQLDLGQ